MTTERLTAQKTSKCTHVATVQGITEADILLCQEKKQSCDSCDASGPHLWLCLNKVCFYVGCGERAVDHSSVHYQKTGHALTLNLTTLRIWCYECVEEVFIQSNDPALNSKTHVQARPRHEHSHNHTSLSQDDCYDSDDDDYEDGSRKPRGLAGLQNIGNTCYMNAALQALSNCPPLTRFFLDCHHYVRHSSRPALAKSYMKLITEMWHKKRPPYLVPYNIASGIKMLHPMFRGYSQQDTQEFLRCFMDQLHEELKDTLMHDPSIMPLSQPHVMVSKLAETTDSSSQSSLSEAGYETCDSANDRREGVSVEDDTIVDGCSEGAGDTDVLEKEVVESSEKDYPDEKEVDVTDDTKQEKRTPKDYKEIENKSFRKQAIDTRHGSPDSGCVHSDSEYSDAQSDLIPSVHNSARKLSPGVGPPSKLTRLNSAAQSQPSPAIDKDTNADKGTKRKRQVQYQSVVSDIFDGELLSSVQCLTCNRISTTRETFQDLSLPIPSKDHLRMLHSSPNAALKGHSVSQCGESFNQQQGWLQWFFGLVQNWFWGPTVALNDCLAAFFSADELKGDNMYSCEKCNKLRNGMKYSKVIKLPEILCIHLKRFRHETMFSSKINNFISFPMTDLDMKVFLHKDCASQVTMYDLAAVICHSGTAGGGHYTAYGLNCINELWYEFDDQYVTEVDTQTVENCEAYVLFYRKNNTNMLKYRQHASELQDSGEPSLMNFYISKQWINKFNTFAEPGPITNTDFLCSHGGVPPHKASYVDDLYIIVPQPAWEYLHKLFGGGPVCSHLYACPTCLEVQKQVEQKRTVEFETFVRLHKEFQSHGTSGAIYALNMEWFKEWENFVKGKSHDPPGPIDNNPIAVKKNDQHILKKDSDYGQISEEIWEYFYTIYGGGPELIQQHVTSKKDVSPASRAQDRA